VDDGEQELLFLGVVPGDRHDGVCLMLVRMDGWGKYDWNCFVRQMIES
jgi:hypothetical protein